MQIDKGILPLVEAMNATEWIETNSSCQGHSKGHSKHPYVEFYCEEDRVSELATILSDATSEFEEMGAPFLIDCSLLFDTCIATNSLDAGDGWVAFHIGMVPLGGFRMDKKDKEIFIYTLANHFYESI